MGLRRQGVSPVSLRKAFEDLEEKGGTNGQLRKAFVIGFTTRGLDITGYGSIRINMQQNGPGLELGVLKVGILAAEEWYVGLACVPEVKGGRAAEIILFRDERKGGSSFEPPGYRERQVLPLEHKELLQLMPIDSPVGVVVLDHMDKFDSRAVGPWLRDRIIFLLDRFDSDSARSRL